MARKILHLDLDAFFCAVEEKLNPSLKQHVKDYLIEAKEKLQKK